MAQIRWVLTALDDLKEIETFVSRDSHVYAARLVDGLVTAVEKLKSFPFLGRMVPEFQRDDLREILHRSYRIIYLTDGEVVTILRVVHAARDLSALFVTMPSELTD